MELLGHLGARVLRAGLIFEQFAAGRCVEF